MGRLKGDLLPGEPILLAGRRYQETAELAFYTPGHGYRGLATGG